MICKDIGLINRRHRRAADRQRVSQGLAKRPSPSRTQIDARVIATTTYIVNIDSKTITSRVKRLDQTVAWYVLNLEVRPGELREIEPGDKVDYAGFRNFASSSIVGQQREMKATMAMSPGGDDLLEHYVISWPADENPSSHQIERAVDVVLDMMGLTDHQAIFGAHSNTKYYHLHIAANRVHPETFKRVQPGSGRQIYALHQAIALIEYEQNWAPSENALFVANERGVFHRESGVCVRDASGPTQFVPKADRDKADHGSREFAAMTETLSDAARLDERRTGEWSLERRARMIAAPIIRRAKNAEEMHADLAEEGFGFETRGSGAVLTLGKQAIKATTAWRGASIHNLEKRWGPGTYAPRLLGPCHEPATPRTLRIEEFRRHDHYDDEKRRHGQARAERKAEIVAASDAAIAAIDEQAAAHRADIDQYGWVGRGNELNVARAVVSSGSAAARGAVAAVRSELLSNLKASASFPIFARWAPWLPVPPVDDVAPGRSAALVSRRHDTPAVPIQLPNHAGIQVGRECHYRDADGRVAFRDLGSVISIDNATDLEVVKDALRLAVAKWGADKLVPFGDRAFLLLVAKAAVDLDLDIKKNATIVKEMARLRTVPVKPAQLSDAQKTSDGRDTGQRTAAVLPNDRMPPRPTKEGTPQPCLNPASDVPHTSHLAQKPDMPPALSPAALREAEELEGLRELRGWSSLVDRWVDTRLSDPTNLASQRLVASAIMRDEVGRQFQHEAAALGFAVATLIAAQAEFVDQSHHSAVSQSSPSWIPPASATNLTRRTPLPTPAPNTVSNRTRALAALGALFNGTEWQAQDYQHLRRDNDHRRLSSQVVGNTSSAQSPTDERASASAKYQAQHNLASQLNRPP